MASDLKKLRNMRASAYLEMKRLADLDRDLSPKEAEEFKGYEAAIGVIDEKIDVEEKKLADEKNLAVVPDKNRLTERERNLMNYGTPTTPPNALHETEEKLGHDQWIDVETGKPVRMLKSNESISSSVKVHRPFSLGRAITGLVTGRWTGAESEKLAMSETINSTGGAMVPDYLSAEFLDLARANSVCLKAGVRTIPMTSDSLTLAKQASDVTFQFKAENDAFNATNPTFGGVAFYPVTLGAMVVMSRELFDDAPNVAQVVETGLAKALGAKVDYTCLSGTGSAMPTGFCYWPTSGENCVGTTGSVGAIQWEDFHTGAVGVRLHNYEPTGYIVNPDIAGDLDIITGGDGVNSSKMWLGAPPSLNGMSRFSTTNITTAFGVIGDFSQAAIGLRLGTEIQVSQEAGTTFANFQVAIRIVTRFDFKILQGSAFHVLTGITT